jgi:decaprenylphospho-beta-D-erythro-pentofuranosid-2-ulose 2-reductase
VLDALGNAQSVLVLGATSDIGSAVVTRLAAGGRLRRVVLAGRPGAARDSAVATHRSSLGAEVAVEAVDLDITEVTTHEDTIGGVFSAGDVDVVVVAAGVLPSAPTLEDPVEAARVVTTNFAGPVAALTVAAECCRRQGHGTIVVLSSVAGERPRRSNYLYGSTKAGLDAFATGLGEDLRDSGVVVLVVRPGFVRTSMTSHLPEAPLAVDADAVAEAVTAHLRGPSRTLWVPATMRPVMSVLRHLPAAVFRRLPL